LAKVASGTPGWTDVRRRGEGHVGFLDDAKDRLEDAMDGQGDDGGDNPSSSSPDPDAGGDPKEGGQPTGPTGPADPTEPTDPSEPAAPTGPTGTGVPGGGGHRPETDPDDADASGSDAGPGERA
jgi:hypothetical protein